MSQVFHPSRQDQCQTLCRDLCTLVPSIHQRSFSQNYTHHLSLPFSFFTHNMYVCKAHMTILVHMCVLLSPFISIGMCHLLLISSWICICHYHCTCAFCVCVSCIHAQSYMYYVYELQIIDYSNYQTMTMYTCVTSLQLTLFIGHACSSLASQTAYALT